ncbi:RNA polymerase sigma factor [Zavarzinia sp. CC-PAN008]|uniref:RNA polymerase sigma factor n=1 Tax=Zavarzinia sp. CC-PAN008 TaxID=3243332 RepID=UPI003F745656
MDTWIEREMVAFLPRLRRFALGLTGSRAAAEDLAQATCERAIRYLDRWDRGSRLDSWMYRIAQNLHRNDLRAGKVRATGQKTLETIGPVSDGLDPSQAATLAHVRALVDGLPEDQRTVLLLIAVEGLSYKEVSEMLEIPMGTVTSRLARARLALANLLGGVQASDARLHGSAA